MVRTPKLREDRRLRARRATAMILALFVMTACSTFVISIVDTETLQYSSLRNTIDWDRARYLAEAGIQHALAELEADITWRTGVANVQCPPGSGNVYSATVTNSPAGNGEIMVSATGTAGNVTRRLQTTVKQGG